MRENIGFCTAKTDGDILKLTAALSMLIDHIGAIICPHISVLRIIGRIAFPIFAFFVAEGCYYTKNKGRYFCNLFAFALITQEVKIAFNDNDDLNIMFTFAAGVTIVFIFQKLYAAFKADKPKNSIYLSLLFVSAVLAVWMLNRIFVFQYNFWGCMTPCIIYTANCIENSTCTKIQLKIIMLAAALTAIYFTYGGVQIWAYAAIPMLICYSGKKGDRVPKYFFYIFYPSHLAVLYLIKNFI